MGIIASQICSTSVDASNTTFKQQISIDRYQRSIAKGFLGKSYGLGKNQYVCNTYVEKALESLETVSAKENSIAGIKNISKKAIKFVPSFIVIAIATRPIKMP